MDEEAEFGTVPKGEAAGYSNHRITGPKSAGEYAKNAGVAGPLFRTWKWAPWAWTGGHLPVECR